MKRILFFLVVLVVTNIQAQDSTLIFLKAGQKLFEVVTPGKIYRYPAFVHGTIHFKDGSQTNARLNYNFLNGEVEFISLKGDTLAIAKEQMLNIRHVVIDTSLFYFDDGYLEEVVSAKNGKLLKKQMYKVTKRERIGGYEQPSSTSAIDTYSSFTNNGQFNYNLTVRENITLVKTTDYYFGDQYNTFLRANKKNLLRLFSKQQQKIEAYLRENTVDFKNSEDLKKLLALAVSN
jgi:hypothetical protein